MQQGNVEEKLKKRIGFLGLLAMCVGLNIGGALFALTTVAADLTGPSLPIAMLISSTPALLAILPYGILTSSLPTTSATYRYSQLFSPTLALVSVLTLCVCATIGGQPLFAKAFGIYLKEILPLDPVLVGVLVLTFFYVINLIGVQLTARIQIVMFFVLLSALLLFIALGITHIEADHFADLFPKGIGGVFSAAGLLFTFCAGGFFVVDLGGEVIKGSRIFPKVLLLGMVIVLVIYISIALITVGAVAPFSLSDESLIAVAENFMSKGTLVYFIVGGALFACATTINILYSILSRGFMVVSSEGLLPAFLGKVSERFGTPYWGLTTAFAISLVALISIRSLMFFGSMLNLGIILGITIVTMAGRAFPERFPELYKRSSIKVPTRLLKVVCWSVIISNSLIFGFFAFAVGRASILFAGIAAVMFLYARHHKERLMEIRIKLGNLEAEWFDTPLEEGIHPRSGP